MTRQQLLFGPVLTCAAICLAVAPVMSDDHPAKTGDHPAKGGDHPAPAAPMVAEGLVFAPFSEDSPVELAVVYGDPEVGPCAVLIKAPPGHRNPMHMHTSSYTAVLVAGSLKQWKEGQTEKDVPVMKPGATSKQPGGQYHAELVGAEGMLAFVSFDGPLDFVPKEEAAK